MTIFNVAIAYGGPAKSVLDIQSAFGPGAGWARYAPNTWLVSVNDTSDAIAKRIRAVIAEADSLLVVEVNLQNNYGYLKKELWDWINKQNAK